MTNKKFKLAAMSLALTACVAASPLAANAETGAEATSSTPAVETPAPTAETSGENAPATNETKQESTGETKQESTDESKQESTGETKQESTDETKQESTDESKKESTGETKQESTDETKQESTDESKKESTDESKKESTDESKKESTDESKQESTNESKKESTDESKKESTDESKQESTDESKKESTDESKKESTDESKQESTDESKKESTDESKKESTDESKQESTDESKKESTDESKQESANESKQKSTDETKQESTDESKQESTDEAKQESTGESKQEAADKNEQNAAVENKVLAEAPAAKAPVLMTAALAPAPAAPATPMEEDTVATITGQDGTTTQYKSFDEAVSKANNGDTIEVIKDATSTGIDLRDKKLTIKGKTVTTTTDSGTEEKTTVKPKLKFVAKEGQSQIAGITLWGSDLTFQNMDVDMTGASATTNHKWNAVCMSGDAALTLKSTDLSMNGKDLDERKDQEILKPQGIYMAGCGRNELNVDDHSTLTINNYYNAIAWDGVGNEDSIYYINIKNGSTFTADGNEAGIVGLESLDVLVEDSTMTITNCRARYPDKTDNRVLPNEHEGRSGLNGADVTITRSNVTISGCEQGYGIHTRDLHVENSTLTTDNNGYSSIFITGKGEFINSTINARGNTGLGNDTIEITRYRNETGKGYHYGSLKVTNSTLNITNNNATGIRCNFGDLNIDDASRVTVQYNKATDNNGYNSLYGLGGGLVVRRGTTAKLGANTTINNNSAALEGADIFIQPGGTLTFSVGNAGIGDILNKGPEDADCGHKIDGWYIDANGSRWNFDADADSAQAFLDSLDELPEGVTVNYDSSTGLYTITVAKTAEDGFALKAAHAELPAPTPDPDGPDTPNPNPNPKPEPKPGPDTSITPEDPQLHPVQDARADTPDSPVLPANRTNPAVQDAHALPQTGTSLFAALAMALSGFALTIAGAWASLLGKNSRH